MTEKEILWYAVRGAREYLIKLGDDTKQAEGEVKKIYSSMFHKTRRELKELERKRKELEEQDALQ